MSLPPGARAPSPRLRSGVPTGVLVGVPAGVGFFASAREGACYLVPMLLEPDLIVESLWLLTPALLRSRGIDGVLIDLDETLLPAGESDLDPRAADWLERLSCEGIAVAILSNGAPRRVRDVCGALRIRGLALAGKPLPLAFRRGLGRLGTPPARSAMVGDQLFTDVLGANLAGLTSILVTPLSPGGLPHTRLARRLERRLLAAWGARPDPTHSTGGDHGRSLDR